MNALIRLLGRAGDALLRPPLPLRWTAAHSVALTRPGPCLPPVGQGPGALASPALAAGFEARRPAPLSRPTPRRAGGGAGVLPAPRPAPNPRAVRPGDHDSP